MASFLFNISSIIFAQTTQGKVTKLTADTFDSFIADNPLSLVKFYAPWCGHCKTLAPHYEEASNKTPAGVVMAEVDVTEEEAVGAKFEIKGFPTIKFFRNGVAEEYTGGRTTDTIIEWLDTMTTDPVNWETTLEKALEEYAETTICVSGVSKDSEDGKIFQKLAEDNRMLCKFIAGGESNTLTVIRAGDKTGESIELSAQSEDVVKFIKSERLPYFGPVSGETFAMYMETGLDFIWFAGSAEDKKAAEESMNGLGKDFRQEFNFVWLDTDVFAKQADGMLGVTEFPAVVRTLDGPGRYVFDGSASDKTSLTKWIEDMKSGAIKAALKSEPAPETNDEPVKVVVGSEFEKIVADDKDVLLEIYAPWCGHCQKLAPAYEEAAAALNKVTDKVVMAKLDGTANEIPVDGYEFRGFPTLYYKKAGEKPVTYSGERDAAAFLQFLSENSTEKFEIPAAKAEDTKDEL